jgi:hypothetical protein
VAADGREGDDGGANARGRRDGRPCVVDRSRPRIKPGRFVLRARWTHLWTRKSGVGSGSLDYREHNDIISSRLPDPPDTSKGAVPTLVTRGIGEEGCNGRQLLSPWRLTR